MNYGDNHDDCDHPSVSYYMRVGFGREMAETIAEGFHHGDDPTHKEWLEIQIDD